MKRQQWLLATLLLAFPSLVSAAILVEDGGKRVRQKKVTSVSSARSGFDFRESHRVAIGMTAGGTLGMLGANIELALNRANSVLVGFGGGPNYQSFGFQWKTIISGRSIMPYTSIGYSRWYAMQPAEGEQLEGNTSPEFIKSKFLNEGEYARGEFAIDLLTPTLGVQYMQLSGPWSGFAMGLEVNLLFSIAKLTSIPTGSLSFQYYF